MAAHQRSQDRRGRWLVLGTTLVVITASLTWFLASRFESPAQRDARAQAPTPVAIWFPVREGKLADQVSGRGTVVPARTEELTSRALPPNAVVTATTSRVGDTIAEGSIAAEVNGEPVFVLRGEFPFYRDLEPGLRGPDVAQMQDALARVGHVIPLDEHGMFGRATKEAVANLYLRHGYEKRYSLPLSSLIVASRLPGVVVAALRVGSVMAAENPLVTIGTGELRAQASMDAALVARVAKGMPATLYRHGKAFGSASVHRIARTSDGTVVLVEPRNRLRRSALNSGVVIIVDIQIYAERAILVPARAIAARDGQSVVVVRRTDGTEEAVTVEVLGELAGVSAVRSSGPSISTADQVRLE